MKIIESIKYRLDNLSYEERLNLIKNELNLSHGKGKRKKKNKKGKKKK